MKKIVWLTEGNWTGKIPRNHRNMRNDAAWMCVLDADHLPLFGQWNDQKYDLAIITLPKKNFEHLVEKDVEIVNLVRKNLATKVAIMQEANSTYWTDYTLDQQIWYLRQLSDTNFLLCHNEYDKMYYTGLFDKSVYVLPTLMIDHFLYGLPTVDRKNTMVGGTCCSWYSGLTSILVASELQIPISVPSMGRKRDGEDKLDGVTYLPYTDWLGWMEILNTFKYGIHLMPTIAAGTFSLNCAALSIPCISNEKIDTQKLCFPELSVDINDIGKAKNLLLKLRDDNDFYNHCSVEAKVNYDKYFSEKVFMNHVNEILKKEL